MPLVTFSRSKKASIQSTLGVPGQINRVKTPYLPDFDETSCRGLARIQKVNVPLLAQSELGFLSYLIRHFHEVALQRCLLKADNITTY